MGIDTSIYSRIQPMQIDSPFEVAAGAAKIHGMRQQNRLADLAFADRERGIEQENALSQAYKSAVGADGQIDRSRLYSGVAQAGAGSKLQGIQKGFADQDKATRDAEKTQIESHLKKFEVAGQIMSGVRDQATWEQARQQTAQMFGPEAAAQMPAQYDPALIEQKRVQAMSVKDQLTQQLNSDKFKLDERQFGEVQRHNKTQEGISYGNLSAAQQNVGLRGKELEQKTASGTGGPGSNKPLPVGALKMRVEAQDAADTADGVNDRLSNVEKRINDKKLSFGPVKNAISAGLNMAGVSTEESRNFASFKSEMEKLRNDSLRLNKGVQTDGDAQRAWNELFQNINDTKLVQQRLTEIKQINARAKNLRLMEVDTIDRNYGRTGNAAAQATPNVDDLLEKYKD
jgi:hypothetical protein